MPQKCKANVFFIRFLISRTHIPGATEFYCHLLEYSAGTFVSSILESGSHKHLSPSTNFPRVKLWKWQRSARLENMMTSSFSALLALCSGNSPVTPVNSPNKGQWRGALMLSLICAWTPSHSLWLHCNEDRERFRQWLGTHSAPAWKNNQRFRSWFSFIRYHAII